MTRVSKLVVQGGFYSKLVHLLKDYAGVVAEELRQHLVCLAGIGLAADKVLATRYGLLGGYLSDFFIGVSMLEV